MTLLDQALQNPSRHASFTPKDEMKARIHSIWRQNLPVLHSRLDLLAAVAAAAKARTLTDPEREEAISIAHKLAGSLGMFGFPEGTVLARQLEAALMAPALKPEILTQLTGELRATLNLAA